MKEKWISTEAKTAYDKVNDLIETLNADDKRKLITKIRSYYYLPKEFTYTSTFLSNDRIYVAKEIIVLYEKAGCVEKDWKHHWVINRAEQIRQHNEFKNMPKPVNRDNQTSINYGSGHSNRGKIRFPRKARKTAWKRFYKLFPHLMPKKEE